MEAFLNQLAEALNAPDANLQSGTKLVDLPNWDSLAILTTISMLDMEYEVTVTGTELQTCVTVDDIFKLVEEA